MRDPQNREINDKSEVYFFFSPKLYKILKAKGLIALERLMEMLLLIMTVQMFIDGSRS
ncbi:MAG: hypothetical protein OQK77_13710 [Psychromonas sp.]|nr:hypothetical protein [Psychromonas sp.]